MLRKPLSGLWGIGLLAAIVPGLAASAQEADPDAAPPEAGIELVYKLEGASEEEAGAVRNVIEKRIRISRVRGVEIQDEGPESFVVRIPGAEEVDVDRLKRLVGIRGDLWFKVVARPQNAKEIDRILGLKEAGEYNPRRERLDVARKDTPEVGKGLAGDPHESHVLLENRRAVSGSLLTKAWPTVDSLDQPAVGFKWGREGAKRFGDLTTRHVGRNLAVVLDGVVKAAPTILAGIGTSGVVQGRFTQEEAQDLAIILQLGALPRIPTLEEERTFVPEGDEESDGPEEGEKPEEEEEAEEEKE